MGFKPRQNRRVRELPPPPPPPPPRELADMAEHRMRKRPAGGSGQGKAGHNYTSTACHHGLHPRCRQECKFCVTACACACHSSGADTPPDPLGDFRAYVQAMREAPHTPTRDQFVTVTVGELEEMVAEHAVLHRRLAEAQAEVARLNAALDPR